MKNTHVLTSTTFGEIKENGPCRIALLPWGATEPHNGHLPYGTDVLTSCAIARDAAQKAASGGVQAMVLPPIPLGSQNPGQTSLPFCLHTSQSTQFAILKDIALSLHRQDIKTLIIVNGHGGNSFKGMIRDLALELPDMFIASCDLFNVVPRKAFFEAEINDHAGEEETSLLMHYCPEMVEMEYATDGQSTGFAIAGLNEKVAWTPRHWDKVSKDTGIGNPFKATADKGERYAEAISNKLARLICDLGTGKIYEEW